MPRFRNVNWGLASHLTEDAATVPHNDVHSALLMDLRDRLDVLRCPDFVAIPRLLKEIRDNLDVIRRNTLPARPKRRATKRKR